MRCVLFPPSPSLPLPPSLPPSSLPPSLPPSIPFSLSSPLPGSQLVYGSHCQLERETDRPIAAYLNVCPSILYPTAEFYHLQIATVVHGLVKILVRGTAFTQV